MKLSAFLAQAGSFSEEFWAQYPHPLLLSEAEGPEREVFVLRARPGTALTLGRGAPAELVVAHPMVSSRHARFHPPEAPGEPWRVEDLGSTNGTLLDGKALEPSRRSALGDGALLRFGTEAEFTFLTASRFRQRLAPVEAAPGASGLTGGVTLRSLRTPVADLAPEDDSEPLPPAPEPERKAKLELFIHCDPLDPLPLPDGARVVIGRKAGSCDWVLADPELSKRHLEVRREGRRVFVRDLGSTNGTFLEGKRLGPEEVELFPRRNLSLGPFKVWVDQAHSPHSTSTPRSSARLELRGDLSAVSLRVLLSDIEAQHKAGWLEVEGEGIRGRVSFADGLPCEASVEGGEDGTGAIRRLLQLRAGSYRLREERAAAPPTRKIRKSFADVLRPAP